MESLTAEELASVASLWRATGRELTTSFQGASMLPTIAPGQKVVILCNADVRTGDVGAVIRGNQLLVHRVVAISPTGRWWLFKGDANRFCDVPVTDARSILGRIEKIERNGAFVALDPPPREHRARWLRAGTAALLELSVPAGVLLLRCLTAVRRAAASARRRRGAGPSSSTSPS